LIFKISILKLKRLFI